MERAEECSGTVSSVRSFFVGRPFAWRCLLKSWHWQRRQALPHDSITPAQRRLTSATMAAVAVRIVPYLASRASDIVLYLGCVGKR